MISYHNFSLRNKLFVINMLTAVIVLFLTCLAFLVVETIRGKNSDIDKLSSIGNIIALHSGASLSFNDTKTATEMLATLGSEPTIIYACLFDANKTLFAHYSCSAPCNGPPPPSPGQWKDVQVPRNLQTINRYSFKEMGSIFSSQ